MKNTLTPLFDWARTEIHPDSLQLQSPDETQLQRWDQFVKTEIRKFKDLLFGLRIDPAHHDSFANVVHTYQPEMKDLADILYHYVLRVGKSDSQQRLTNFYQQCLNEIIELLYHVGYNHTAYFDLFAYIPKYCIDTIGGAEQARFALLKTQLSKKGTPAPLLDAINGYVYSFKSGCNKFVTYHDIQYLKKLVTALDNTLRLQTEKCWLHTIWEQIIYLNFNRTAVISYFKDYIVNYAQEDDYIIQKEKLLGLQTIFAEMPENNRWYCRSDRPMVKEVVSNAISQEIMILDMQQEERDRDAFRKKSNYFVLDLSARSMMLLVQINKQAGRLPYNSVAQTLSIMYSCFRPTKGRGTSPNVANALKKEIDASTVRNLTIYLKDLQRILDEKYGHYL